MATDKSVTESVVVDEVSQQREGFIRGLRELATFLEAQATVPAPSWATIHIFVDKKEDLARIARVGRWDKVDMGDWFTLSRDFAGSIALEVSIPRAQLCRKVVTGTRLEPAQPERKVEEFMWVCDEPLLTIAKAEGGAR